VRADAFKNDICESRKTVKTVFGSVSSLVTAINRGVNEKVAFTEFNSFIQLHTAIRQENFDAKEYSSLLGCGVSAPLRFVPLSLFIASNLSVTL
jgi:hypothetical protein